MVLPVLSNHVLKDLDPSDEDVVKISVAANVRVAIWHAERSRWIVDVVRVARGLPGAGVTPGLSPHVAEWR